MAQNLQKGAAYKPLEQSLDPRTTTLRQTIDAYAATLTQEGAKNFKASFQGKTQFAPIFKDYLDKPAVDFVETFADDEMNPLIQAYEKNEKVNARRNIYSQIGAIEFTINDQLKKAGALSELYPEGMPLATDRVTRPDKPKAKARRYSYNPGLLGEWLVKLDEYGKKNPQDIGIVKALEAQMHMGLRPGEVMNAPASALVRPEKRSAAWGFFLDTDTPGVKMDENLNIAVGPRTYNIMQQALAVSPANDRNLFVNPDGSPIGKGEMTRVIKEIKVPGIMTDELTGRKLNSFQEAYDARRMWVTLALNEFPGEGNRVGAAQGRAVGAVTKGGGAVKEYYSPSRGFYSKAATAVPDTIDSWLFEARVDELPERMQPPEGQRISFSTDFTGPQLSPVFEPKDAPIKVGDLEARFVEPSPKTEVVRPAASAQVPVAKQPVTPASVDEAFPGMADKAIAKGVNTDSLLSKMLDKLGKGVKGAVLLEIGRQFVEAPLETGQAIATEIGLEGAARTVGFGAAPAAAVPMMLAPSELASGELRPEDRPADPAGPYAGQDFIPAREVEQTDQDMMARLATQDSGMIPEPDRVPQAAPVRDEGFLSR
mgnify:CR=1 FL=1|tara:strand:- start:1012 stop:2802 length:1791 start_codon:yes stop_codon:yes gene_type:complete